MKRRKLLLGSGAIFASGGFMTGTQAFSSAEVERNVKIEIVGDKNAILGLKEDEMGEDGVLFGGHGSRTAPETFDVINQHSAPVDIDITLLEGKLEFTDVDSSEGEESIELNPYLISITDLQSGTQISDVTIEISQLNSRYKTDTLQFEVEGDGLHINAKRELTLEPAELDAGIKLENINAPIKIDLPSGEEVDKDTLSITIDDNLVETKSVGESNNIRLDFEEKEELGCDSPDDSIDVDVKGKTVSGIPFSGTAQNVNCSN